MDEGGNTTTTFKIQYKMEMQANEYDEIDDRQRRCLQSHDEITTHKKISSARP